MGAYKVHTDDVGRLLECMKKAMYGVSHTAIEKEMPKELLSISKGDIVYISEKEVSKNALFGPFYVVDCQEGIISKRSKGCWKEIDVDRSNRSALAYWIEVGGFKWCIFFDKTLIDRVSVVWPNNWNALKVKLPTWGKISESDTQKLLEYSVRNEQEAKEFFKKHC